ncbi:MAG: ABC transporter ATP-binding protein [Defluviitaleaceae bacterium]|nr:ABC transporter ATP-binding protein [Defluviitaleaceae bacterium]
MEALFDLRNVRKVYRMGEERIVALEDISITFEKGKIYCLLGTSGSGKSTLLNMLAGLEKPTKGSIIFMGKPLEKLNEKQLALYRQRYVGFVFQSYNLLPTLTALENVTLPLTFRKIKKRERVKRARVMLKAVGLGNRARHKPSELSGGQQQRVSIARAFINNPQVVFADEPTGNLDTRTTFEMMDLIIGIARERQQTLVIVTHDTEIAQYADQVIHIRDGSIESITERKAIMNQSEIGNEDENKNATDGGNGNEETIV